MKTEEPASPRLHALDFAPDIGRLTEEFAGRQWIFEAIEDWLKHSSERFFILTGEPGVGKSALAARLTQVREDMAAFHFCIAGRNSTIRAATVLRSLAAQLAENLPGYGEALATTIEPTQLSIQPEIRVGEMTGGEITGVIIQNLHAGEPHEELDILLRAPLAELPTPPTPVIILVDSLDEAVTYQGQSNLVTLLAGLDDLPSWVRFVCTSRPERRVLRYFEGLAAHVLAAESQMNLEDLRLYITNRLAKKEIAARVQAAEVEPAELSARLVELSEGNFLYAKILLDDMQAGRQRLDDLAALPGSLDEVYHGFLRRFTVSQWEERYQPMLSVLAAAQEPITEDQLAAFSGLPRGKTRQQLGVLVQFLDSVEEPAGRITYRLFHQSFRDYLLDENRNQDFWCPPEDGHGSIAAACLKLCRDQWDACDEYCRQHVCVHLAEAQMWEQLAGLIEDPRYLLAAEPGRLLGVINMGWGRLPLGSVGVYQRTAHLIRDSALPAAASYLELAARQGGVDELADRVVQLQLRRPWSVAWVRWQPPGPHQELTSHHNILGGQALLAVSELDDRPVVVSASDDIRVTDMESGAPIAEPITDFEDKVTALAVADLDGRPVVVSASAEGVRLWQLADGAPLGGPLPGYTGTVHALAVAELEDGPVVVAGCEDRKVRVWRLLERSPNSESLVHVLAGASGKVRDVAAGELAGRPVVVAGGDGKIIRIRDLVTGEPIGEPLAGHTAWVETVCFSKLGDRTVIVSGGVGEAGVRVWDPTQGRQISTHQVVPKGGIRGSSAIYSADVGKIEGRPVVVTGSYNQHIQFWNLTDGTPVGGALVGHEGPVRSVVWTELWGRPVVVSGGQDGTVRVWPLAAGLPGEGTAAHQATASYAVTVAELEGRPVICTADRDWNLRVLDLATGELVGEVLPNLLEFPSFVFGLVEGRHVLIVGAQDVIGIWDPVEEQRLGAPLQPQFNDGGNLMRPKLTWLDGRPVVLVGSHKGGLWVGDLLSGETIAMWRAKKFSTLALGELGGRRLVAVGEYGKESTIQLRNLADGVEAGKIASRHEGYLSALGLGELGQRPVVVSGGSEGNLRLWGLDGELVSEIQFGARIDDIVIAPEALLVVSTTKGIAVLKFSDDQG